MKFEVCTGQFFGIGCWTAWNDHEYVCAVIALGPIRLVWWLNRR